MQRPVVYILRCRMRALSVIFAGSLFVMAAGVTAQTGVPPPVPVRNILYARPFTLEKPYRNDWSKEHAMVSSGVLVVLEVDPQLVIPRDSWDPVLYAGDVTVQRLNNGYPSGHVIGIIPGKVDLSAMPMWFGTEWLPERVTREMARAERARAEKAEIRPFSAKKIAA